MGLFNDLGRDMGSSSNPLGDLAVDRYLDWCAPTQAWAAFLASSAFCLRKGCSGDPRAALGSGNSYCPQTRSAVSYSRLKCWNSAHGKRVVIPQWDASRLRVRMRLSDPMYPSIRISWSLLASPSFVASTHRPPLQRHILSKRSRQDQAVAKEKSLAAD